MKFRHKGMRRLYERGDESGVAPDHLPRLRRVLTALEQANVPTDLDRPGLRLHRLRPSERWSVRISANWRVTFRFVEGEAVEVDLLDYH